MSSKLSFSELFEDLEKYLKSSDDRWRLVVRVKRGIENTGDKVGYYKD